MPSCAGKEVLVDVVADDRYILAMKVLEIGEESSLNDVRVVDVLVGRSRRRCSRGW